MKKDIQTIISVSSPFQVMCAMEAVSYYSINTFRFIVSSKRDLRGKQTCEILSFFKIESYEWIDETQTGKIKTFIVVFFKMLLKRLWEKDSNTQIIIGDVLNTWQRLYALKYANPHSKTMIVDDGNNTMAYLSGKFDFHPSLKARIFAKTIDVLGKTDLHNLFFTIYSDIALCQYKCERNTFEMLKNYNGEKLMSDDVYVIGTNTAVYCRRLGISLEEFSGYMDKLFDMIRQEYPMSHLFFVPHGRDNTDIPRKICKKHNVDYKRPDTIIELMLLLGSNYPKTIYGFSSTALFTLSILFEKTKAFNVIVNDNCGSNNAALYDLFSTYLEKHGVINIRL